MARLVYVRMLIGAYRGQTIEVREDIAENGIASGTMESVTPEEARRAEDEELGKTDEFEPPKKEARPKAKKTPSGVDALLVLPGVGRALAERLVANGFGDLASLAAASVDEIAAVPGLGGDRAASILEAAIDLSGE